MEQNQFEGLEDVEVQEIKPINEIKVKKEYEKLLQLEADREDYDKAKNLINFGCFEQKEVQPTEINFANLEKLDIEKKFKGVYDLYRVVDTNQLLFVQPLVENNKAEGVDTDMKPYAYDVLYIEEMDNDTYKKVLKAGRNNLKSLTRSLYGLSLAFLIVDFILSLFIFFAVLIYQTTVSSSTFISAVQVSFLYSGPLIAGFIIALPLATIMRINYKRYTEGK